jgi:FtsP/CotA-like multicopper oxidase with cupredoxin domain
LAVQSIAWALSRRTVLSGTGLVVAATIGPAAPAAGQAANRDVQVLSARSGRPGPALRLRRGDEVRVRLHNDLGEPTAIHWHGVRLTNAMDGVPGLTQMPVAPGAIFDYRFTVPDAGTFWYHAALAADGRRLGGPYGSLQVDEPEPVAVDRDHLLLADGQIAGRAGDLRLRRNERLRLRLVNASGRLLQLRLDRLPAWVMAIDGQPSEPFVARDGRVLLGPGNRVDLFIDATLAAGETSALIAEGARGDMTLLLLSPSAEPPLRPTPLLDPRPLPSNGLPERMDFRSALRPQMTIAAERAVGAAPPLFTVRRGGTVVLACVNQSEEPRILHLHGHSFRLLDRLDDGWKPFWLDTAVVPPRQALRIAFVAENPGKWLIEAEPSVAWFDVR